MTIGLKIWFLLLSMIIIADSTMDRKSASFRAATWVGKYAKAIVKSIMDAGDGTAFQKQGHRQIRNALNNAIMI